MYLVCAYKMRVSRLMARHARARAEKLIRGCALRFGWEGPPRRAIEGSFTMSRSITGRVCARACVFGDKNLMAVIIYQMDFLCEIEIFVLCARACRRKSLRCERRARRESRREIISPPGGRWISEVPHNNKTR